MWFPLAVVEICDTKHTYQRERCAFMKKELTPVTTHIFFFCMRVLRNRVVGQNPERSWPIGTCPDAM